MRSTLLNLLRCPGCRGRLTASTFVASPDGDEVVEGELICRCGLGFPIVDTIPRMLVGASALFPSFMERYRGRLTSTATSVTPNGSRQQFERLLTKTRESFGYQWTAFSQMVCDFRENFWNYLSPATPEFFRGRLGLDAGCGFGRHIYHAASYGAEMIGVDVSRAIDATRQNTKQFRSVHLVQADIYQLPFAEGIFDFIYSVGVIHHLPDPARGLKSLVPLLKPGGTLFLWLYSSKRKVVNFLLETIRPATTRMPHRLLQVVSWASAAIDWSVFVLPYQTLKGVRGFAGPVERLTPARVKLYSRYPFQVLYADWFDRLATPIRFYYDEAGVRALVGSGGLSDIQVTPTGLYGWRACGIRREQAQGIEVSGLHEQKVRVS